MPKSDTETISNLKFDEPWEIFPPTFDIFPKTYTVWFIHNPDTQPPHWLPYFFYLQQFSIVHLFS